MNRNSSPFKWCHYAPDVILLCVRWYCRFQLSYRDVEEMMRERGLDVDHSTVFRWVQRYAPELDKRIRPHLKMSGASYRLDETYVKVGKTCKYLYRAVDKDGNTIEFMLSAKRDVSAAKRFFKKMIEPSIVGSLSLLVWIRTQPTLKHSAPHKRSGSCLRTASLGG